MNVDTESHLKNPKVKYFDIMSKILYKSIVRKMQNPIDGMYKYLSANTAPKGIIFDTGSNAIKKKKIEKVTVLSHLKKIIPNKKQHVRISIEVIAIGSDKEYEIGKI